MEGNDIMKTVQIIAAAFILGTSISAMAQQANADGKEIVHGKTRAEVVAELKQAEAEGKAMPTGFVAYDAPAKVSTASNTAVARK